MAEQQLDLNPQPMIRPSDAKLDGIAAVLNAGRGLRSRAVRNIRAPMIRSWPRPFHAIGRPDHRDLEEDSDQDCRVPLRSREFHIISTSSECPETIAAGHSPCESI
jgi:hypothetical protein